MNKNYGDVRDEFGHSEGFCERKSEKKNVREFKDEKEKRRVC